MIIQIPLNAFTLETNSTDTKRTTTAYFTVPAHIGINSASLSYVTRDTYGGNTQDAALYLDSTVRAHDNSWLAPGGKTLLTSIFTPGQHSYRFHLKSNTASSNTWKLATIVLTLDYTPPVSNPGTITLNKSSMLAGETVGISLSAADAGVTRTIQAKWGSTVLSTIVSGKNNTAGNYTYTFPLADCSRMPNSTSGTLSIVMTGSVGNPVTKTMTIQVPDTVVPTITSVTATKLTNGVNAAITGYVQGYSGVEIKINGAAGALGSTISAYKITGGGFDRSSATEQLTPLPSSGDIVFTGEITDSRGRKASGTVTITVLSYTSVSANNVAAYRSDASKAAADEGAFATLRANLIFSSLNSQNVGAVKGRVYEKGTTAPAYTSMVNDTLVLFGGSLSVEKAYTVDIEISDLITSYVYTIEIPTGTVIMGITPDGDGVSFGVYPEAGKMKSAWPIVAPGIPPNPNILHNWDFRNPVNQRGVSGAISTGTYFYDRWMRNSGTVTVGAGYLTLASGAVIEQRIEGLYLAGETVTVSVRVGSTIYNGTGVFPTSAGTSSVTLTGFGTATLGYNSGYMFVRFSADAERNVTSVKVELGTVSTLHLDPPVDHAIELPKCQRFYRRVDNANGAVTWFYGRSGFGASGQFWLVIPGPQMRTNPTFVYDNVFMVVYNGEYYAATVTSVMSTFYGIIISGTCSTSVPKLMPIVAWANYVVEFSADL